VIVSAPRKGTCDEIEQALEEQWLRSATASATTCRSSDAAERPTQPASTRQRAILALAVADDAPGEFEVQFELRGLCDGARLWRYSVSQPERERADLRIEPGTEFAVSPPY